MSTGVEYTSRSHLGRFVAVGDPDILAERVRGFIRSGFEESRCYPIIADSLVVSRIADGVPLSELTSTFIDLKNRTIQEISGDNQIIANRMKESAWISTKLTAAIALLHRALAAAGNQTLISRRFVFVGSPFSGENLTDLGGGEAVIAHVGQGPEWTEVSSIYIGLDLLDVLVQNPSILGMTAVQILTSILQVEERAIETGYTHTEDIPAELRAVIDKIDERLKYQRRQPRMEYPELPEEVRFRPFTPGRRKALASELNARDPADEMNFDYRRCVAAIAGLERLALRFKRVGDEASIREVMRLLVAASGHDIHEVRNRANILIERLLSPKEFGAPIATYFLTVRKGEEHHLSFGLPKRREGYFVRVYRNASRGEYNRRTAIDFVDFPLRFDRQKSVYTARSVFEDLGTYDFLVYHRVGRRIRWCSEEGCSGRINVLPDLRGELILEVFPDIHGHTRVYWAMTPNSPGLVYNEHGEVIRLGNLDDITDHLAYLQTTYGITALYLLGVQTRGRNRQDWSPQATSPSPFSPMSLVTIEDFLGGERAFKALVSRAHDLGMKIIVDIIPHLNRTSSEIPEDWKVQCYDSGGNLVVRSSTDGRFGTWNDGMLLNYRKLDVWEWMAQSVVTLIEKYGIDGIRIDSAHAIPIMMKKENYPFVYGTRRSAEEMIEGNIIVNDREDEHFITTGYYDSACREIIAIPFHYFLQIRIEQTIRRLGKEFFITLAECYWGRERYLVRTGSIPYNSALFKICEKIIHGESDVREIYHLYDTYYRSILPRGTFMLGILGNHDERRALNTFGHRGLRAAVALTIFLNEIVMDYEGSAEGEGWKVFLDNIYVNWNQFERASHRSLENFYRWIYQFHRRNGNRGHLIWAGNPSVAAALKAADDRIWIGAFNFSDSSQGAILQFDSPEIPVVDDAFYELVDPLYSHVTNRTSLYAGYELRVSKIHTHISSTDRFKLLKLEKVPDISKRYASILEDSLFRLVRLSDPKAFPASFFFRETGKRLGSYRSFSGFLEEHIVPMTDSVSIGDIEIALKRTLFHGCAAGLNDGRILLEYVETMASSEDPTISDLGGKLRFHFSRGPMIFLAAESEPFSKSGGLANVVMQLPKSLAGLGEDARVITPIYGQGTEKSRRKMRAALDKYGVAYTGKTVSFTIEGRQYIVGIHTAMVEGVRFYLLDNHELFDGLYWGITSREKLVRRIGFARACAETILALEINPIFVFTNDAFAGLFGAIVRSDPGYSDHPVFKRASLLHIIHNGGWQYFDSFHRGESGRDLFPLFGLPPEKAPTFLDPVHNDRLNCMAAGVRSADRVITVSPSYARQIEVQCDGLEFLLSGVIGINNALNDDFERNARSVLEGSGFVEREFEVLVAHIVATPSLKKKVEQRYPEILEGWDAIRKVRDKDRQEICERMLLKLLLQAEQGLTVDPDLVLCCMIHRIADQKGFQLLLEASEGMFKTLGFQAIIGGIPASGDQRGEELARGCTQLQSYYPGRVATHIDFVDVSIPLLACDVFLMPSMSEPGGISQLEGMACGCIIVARSTGGLRDTVSPIRLEHSRYAGHGFLFTDYTTWAFYDSMHRCMEYFRDTGDTEILRARRDARKSVNTWDRSAKEYIRRMYSLREMIRPI